MAKKNNQLGKKIGRKKNLLQKNSGKITVAKKLARKIII